MKKETLVSRLSQISVNKNSYAYKMMIDFLATGRAKCRPVHTSGTGRFITNLDYTQDFIALCEKLKLKIEVGNDAPRGGLCGNYVKILTKIS